MNADDTRLYFAYGSNLHAPRMRERVPSAVTVAVGRLSGFDLAFAKRGADGSGKCDIVTSEAACVWGVVYRIARAEQPALDAAEAGYDEIGITVSTPAGRLAVFTYRSRPGARGGAAPRSWYRDIVLAGAREHGLPEDHIARIEAAARAVEVPTGLG